jgi:hypothetical protein
MEEILPFTPFNLTRGKGTEIEVMQERRHVCSENSRDGERGTSSPFAAG